MTNDVLALIVLYKPNPSNLLTNVEAVVNQVDALIILDNSPNDYNANNYSAEIGSLISRYNDKITFKHNESNLGLPLNYNYAIDLAKMKNMKFLLLLDQDSKLSENVVKELLSSYYKLSKTFKVGAVSALNQEQIEFSSDTALWGFYERRGMYKKDEIREVAFTINSGFLAPISVYHDVGQYNEKYFLDCVDQEMSLRMRKHGYKIFIIENAVVYHSEGELFTGRFLFSSIQMKRQVPIRYYYISRGTFQLLYDYFLVFPSLSFVLLWSMIGRNIKIVSYPSKRLRSWFYTLLGIIHFLKGIHGEIKES